MAPGTAGEARRSKSKGRRLQFTNAAPRQLRLTHEIPGVERILRMASATAALRPAPSVFRLMRRGPKRPDEFRAATTGRKGRRLDSQRGGLTQQPKGAIDHEEL